jgi:hypothetical protein
MSEVVGLPNNSYKPITNTAWVRARLCNLQKGCTRLAAASDKVYQLLAHDRWFSPGTPATSTTKTGRHGIAEILLKVALNTINKSSQCPGKYYQRGRKKILQDCIPGVLKEMKKILDTWIGFNKILVNKEFPLNNIAFYSLWMCVSSIADKIF